MGSCGCTGPRIAPTTEENLPAESAPIVADVKSNLGMVPNLFATVAHSPAALKMLNDMFQTLGSAKLAGKPAESIALRIAQLNGCQYCLAAHTALAQQAGLSADDTIEARKGNTDCEKGQTLLNLAEAILDKKDLGETVKAAREKGATDEELIETVAFTALNFFTNSINHLCRTEVDFPAAPALDD